MKITPRALICIVLLPLFAEGKETEWNSKDNGSTYTITADSEHIVQDLNANWKDTMFQIESDEIESSENKIQIKKRNQNLEFYINGKRIAKSDLPELEGSKIGFYLREGDSFTIQHIEIRTK